MVTNYDLLEIEWKKKLAREEALATPQYLAAFYETLKPDSPYFCNCDACYHDMATSSFSMSERFSWLMTFGWTDYPKCKRPEGSLARQRLAWLMLQALKVKRGKRPVFPMPLDPQPQFWGVITKRHKENSATGIIQQLKEVFRIEEIAGRHTPLRGGYQIMSGPCFLHNGTGSEFVIWIDEQKWRCFGRCGAGGDVIDLVEAMKLKGLEWRRV